MISPSIAENQENIIFTLSVFTKMLLFMHFFMHVKKKPKNSRAKQAKTLKLWLWLVLVLVMNCSKFGDFWLLLPFLSGSAQWNGGVGSGPGAVIGVMGASWRPGLWLWVVPVLVMARFILSTFLIVCSVLGMLVCVHWVAWLLVISILSVGPGFLLPGV